MRLASDELEEVSELTSLGSMMLVDEDMEAVLKHRRLGEGGRVMGGLCSLWRNRGTTVGEKMGMFGSIFLPTVLNAIEKRMLEMWDGKCARKVRGAGVMKKTKKRDIIGRCWIRPLSWKG